MMPAFCGGDGIYYWEVQRAQEEEDRKTVAEMVRLIRRKEYAQLEKYINAPVVQKHRDFSSIMRKKLSSFFPGQVKENSRDMQKRESCNRVLIHSLEEENYAGLYDLIAKRKESYSNTDRYYLMLTLLHRALDDHLHKSQELSVMTEESSRSAASVDSQSQLLFQP